MLSSLKTSSRRPLAARTLVLTQRDIAVLDAVWDLRQATREQLQWLHFGGRAGAPGACSSSVCMRRVGLMHAHGYLIGRRLPVSRGAGAVPYVYSLGPKAVPLVARARALDSALVRRRQRQDARLAWMFAEHRLLTNDVRVAFLVACRPQGIEVSWRDDHALAAQGYYAEADGERLPVRPDGFFVLRLPAGTRAAFALELQHQSGPVKYRQKVRAYEAFWRSGAYAAAFGLRSLRVLGVAGSRVRAQQLKQAAEAAGGSAMFWSAALSDVLAGPLAAKWWVAGQAEQQVLLEGKRSGV